MSISLTQRIISGARERKSRLHDEKGHLIPLSELFWLPQNLYHIAMSMAFGIRPQKPWFTYAAIRRIERIIQPTWRMIEFGSGMSTQWFAKRVNSVHSIEDNQGWYEKVRSELPSNVQYELRSPYNYADLSDYPDEHFDFAVVDGVMRGRCMQSVLPKMKRGGYLYFDNSDKDMLVPGGDCRIAEETLKQWARSHDTQLEYIVGLSVCLLSPHEGILARL